jgi:hypothetical protein
LLHLDANTRLILPGDKVVYLCLCLAASGGPKQRTGLTVDHINLPLNDYTRSYVDALLAAAILRVALPRLRPREADAIWTVMPERK